MKISIDFGHPYFEQDIIFALEPTDLNDFYCNENEVNGLNLFFVLEASLHRFQSENKTKAAARCAFLMAYYLFVPLTPPASFELAEFYIDRALEWNEMPEYREWKDLIDKGN
jgi:hypothetical protein